MADKNFKIGASIEVDNKQIKTEFTKAGELAGESVAKGLESKGGDIQNRITDEIDNIKAKIEELSSIDFNIEVNSENATARTQALKDELILTHNTVVDLEEQLRLTGQNGGEALEELKDITDVFSDNLRGALNEVKENSDKIEEGMKAAEESTKDATEAVKELNEEADKGISENGGLGKMLKFLTSKEIFNFFYRNLKKIGEQLIELSGDGERLATMFEPVQEKLEIIGGYIGKGLVPAVETAIGEIDSMANELVQVGEDGSSSLDMLQKGVYWIGQGFTAVIKIIKQFGQYLGTQVSNWYVLVTAFWQDFYDTAKSVITGIGNTDNWTALGNNIKYGIVQGVNGAIESLNGLLGWINKNLGIDLGEIKTISPGQKQSYDFGNFEFGRTKEALKDIAKTNIKFVKDIGEEWKNAWNNAKDGAEDLMNYTEFVNTRIKKDTEEKISGKGGSKKDSVKGAYEQLEEEAVDVWKEMSGLVDEHQKSYDKLTEQIDKVREDYDKLRKDAKKTWEEAEKSLKDYNNELEKAQGEAITDLGQRYVELQKQLMGVDDQIKEQAQKLSRGYIQTLQKVGITDYKGYELKELIDLKEKLDELQLIEENTTEEQRQQEAFLKETSKTQEILNNLKEKEAELEEKKATALEKQAIANAMMNQEDGKEYIKTLEDKGTFYYDAVKKQWQQIHNEENIEYAKQLEDQAQNLNEQLAEYKKEKDTEVEILIDTTARKIELENEFQLVFEENVKKQEKELDNLIKKEEKLIELRREYLSMGGSGSHNAYGGTVLNGHASIVGENGPETIIARQSSYVQPRNAGNSYNTVNTNNLNINGLEFGNFNTIDDMLNELKERLTYRS